MVSDPPQGRTSRRGYYSRNRDNGEPVERLKRADEAPLACASAEPVRFGPAEPLPARRPGVKPEPIALAIPAGDLERGARRPGLGFQVA